MDLRILRMVAMALSSGGYTAAGVATEPLPEPRRTRRPRTTTTTLFFPEDQPKPAAYITSARPLTKRQKRRLRGKVKP